MKAVALLVILFATPLIAHDVDDDNVVIFLVPISVKEPVAGAYGTRWVSELWIHNGWEFDISLAPECPDIPVPCVREGHAPGTTAQAFDSEFYGGLTAMVYHLHASFADKVILSSRLFELSRLAQPAGVEMPVVREDEFFLGPSRFIAVPRSNAVRSALRVYDARHRVGSSVRVRVVSPDGQTLGERVFPLQYTVGHSRPGMILLPDLVAVFPQLVAVDRYDVIVSPLDEAFDYWAFVSVTDNDTQQVFTITHR